MQARSRLPCTDSSSRRSSSLSIGSSNEVNSASITCPSRIPTRFKSHDLKALLEFSSRRSSTSEQSRCPSVLLSSSAHFFIREVSLQCFNDTFLLRHLLGIKPNFRDLEVYDPELFRSLQRLLAVPNAESWAGLDFTDLSPQGESTPVTDDNKHQFVQHKLDTLLIGSRLSGLNAIKVRF